MYMHLVHAVRRKDLKQGGGDNNGSIFVAEIVL